jgi:hypothetical protein
MSDPKELANKARTTLSQALAALQSGDDVPDALLEVAESIAKTMGVLHKIERNGTGSVEDLDKALDAVRSVLDSLQHVATDFPAVDGAMEAVAGSLSKMFALSKALKAAGEPAKAQAAVKAEPAPPARAELASAPVFNLEPAPRIKPEPARPAAAEPAEATSMAAPAKAAKKTAASAGHPLAEPVPSKPEQRVATAGEAPPAAQGGRRFDVELGAHSGSNFYKGLSGNDVIDHGGIFVATYQVPKVGEPVLLRVHLPGDLEFDADAVVQWTRDVRSGESDPGFGARVTRISAEGRQLVYRYVRNREPMFYDDL